MIQVRQSALEYHFDERWLYGASSNAFGSPQAEFEIPYGHLAQNAGYSMIAQRYRAVHGYDERAMAKIPGKQAHAD